MSIAMVAVVAAGFISSSGVSIGLAALLFVIATGTYEARNRRSGGGARWHQRHDGGYSWGCPPSVVNTRHADG
ncbi:hypothetical protein GW570_15130 (plasmid) [Clavibacter capsici]|uniref:Uncharacterized protein n=2 Tax=Clavibacter capsici TaxID=1874630 RepID=A0AAE6XSJ2_9MICO|nr:hypothetical protein [Clavibacter capsici]QIS46507.1 hypothetical protein GW570_15130 [Clavibacter capsici]